MNPSKFARLGAEIIVIALFLAGCLLASLVLLSRLATPNWHSGSSLIVISIWVTFTIGGGKLLHCFQRKTEFPKLLKILLLGALTTSVLTSIAYELTYFEEFDSRRWKNEASSSQLRKKMARSLVENFIDPGMSRGEIVKLLGEADINNKNTFVYCLEKSPFYLTILFKDNEVVNSGVIMSNNSSDPTCRHRAAIALKSAKPPITQPQGISRALLSDKNYHLARKMCHDAFDFIL